MPKIIYKTQITTLDEVIALINKNLKPEQNKISKAVLFDLLTNQRLIYQNLYAQELRRIAEDSLKPKPKKQPKKSRSDPNNKRVIIHPKKNIKVNKNDGWTDCSKLTKQTLVLKPKNSL